MKELTKKVTVSMKESELEMARNLSVLTFGTENVSGYIRFLIRNENKTKRKGKF
jgi:hypothetical protein